MKLNSISQGDKAKEKLLEAIELDPNFGFAYIMLSTFGTNTVERLIHIMKKQYPLRIS